MSIIRELARLGNKIDSASTGQFLSKGSTTGSFGTISYTDLTGRPTTLDSSAATSIVDSAYIQARQASAGGGGLDSALTTQLIDSSYIAARAAAASSGYQMYEYTASQGQTTFQDSDINGNVLSYSEGGALVFYNGVLLGASDITATSGSSVVLTTGADSGSHVAITKWSLAGGGSGGASFTWGGERGFMLGGYVSSTEQTNGVYWSIPTSTSSTTFGNLSHKCVTSGCVSGGSGAYTLVGAYRYLSGGSWAYYNNIDRVSLPGTPSVSDFGDFTAHICFNGAWCGNGTRALHGGGQNTSGTHNVIEYFTFATPGNGTDFGDMQYSAAYKNAGVSGSTYALVMGRSGYNNIQYMTVDTTGNAADWGDLHTTEQVGGTCSNATTALCAFQNTVTRIDYLTMASQGNASDFGDLTMLRDAGMTACTDGTDAHFFGGRTVSPYVDTPQVDKVTIATPGNASDFGDLSRAAQSAAGGSGAAA